MEDSYRHLDRDEQILNHFGGMRRVLDYGLQ